MQRSSLTLQVAPVMHVRSAFRVITASPLMSLLKRMISIVETDSDLCINNLCIWVEENSFKAPGFALRGL
jgi:hypothetical protein